MQHCFGVLIKKVCLLQIEPHLPMALKRSTNRADGIGTRNHAIIPKKTQVTIAHGAVARLSEEPQLFEQSHKAVLDRCWYQVSHHIFPFLMISTNSISERRFNHHIQRLIVSE
jgi:hypothetical protein